MALETYGASDSVTVGGRDYLNNTLSLQPDIRISDTGSVNLSDPMLAYDGVHSTAKGANLKGAIDAAALLGWISTDPYLPATGELTGNLNANWAMSGTGGTLGANVSGVVGTGYTATNAASGATVVASKGALASGQAATVLTCSGTPTSDVSDIALTSTVSLSTALGDALQMAFEFEITAADGVSDPVGLYAFYGALNPNDIAFMGANGDPSVAAMTKYPSVARTHQFGYSTGGSSASAQISFRLQSGSPCDAVIKIGRVFVIKEETTAYAAPKDQSTNPQQGGFGGPFVVGGGSVGGNIFMVFLGSFSGGGLTFTYQWQKDGVDVPGATASNYTPVATGSHVMNVIATNSFGSATSSSNATVVT